MPPAVDRPGNEWSWDAVKRPQSIRASYEVEAGVHGLLEKSIQSYKPTGQEQWIPSTTSGGRRFLEWRPEWRGLSCSVPRPALPSTHTRGLLTPRRPGFEGLSRRECTWGGSLRSRPTTPTALCTPVTTSIEDRGDAPTCGYPYRPKAEKAREALFPLFDSRLVHVLSGPGNVNRLNSVAGACSFGTLQPGFS